MSSSELGLWSLADARAIAEGVVEKLSPVCSRISIAGSIRREKAIVKDIEIVCIPNDADIMEFFGIINQWQAIKGKATGKYTQRMLPEGIKCDIFIAKPDNWGLQLAIRTGSATYSHLVLAKGWSKRHFKAREGMLTKRNDSNFIIPIREEQELFDLIKIPYLEPKYREFL
jgi:DNA polymerase/3'-5' exonuclease PolX